MDSSVYQADVVSKRTKFAFSVGHVLNDLSASMWFSYLLVFFHRVVNFSNASAGYLLLAGQVADALATVFVGFESDRTRRGLFSYGRRKTWHLVGVICVICSFPFCFNVCVGCADSDLWAQFIYYVMFIIIFQFGWSCSQITHLAMINELTHKDGERVALNSYRYAWTVIANISVYALASVLFGVHSGDDKTDITPADAHIFRTLTLAVVVFGLICMVVFHIGIKESELPAEECEHRLQMTLTSSGRLKRMTWKSFLREREFYQCALIWMFTRMILNVTQVFLSLYIIDTIGTLDRIFVAIAPLCSYISGLLASFPMRTINKRLGRKGTMIVGLVFVLASSAIFWFIPKLTTVIQIEVVLIVACVLLGIGTSTTNICSSSLASDLIGLNTECGAFVYGVMSFADKIANGVVIAALQQFNPCSNDATDVCRLYYREILTFIPAAVAVLTVIMTITIWRTKIGGNRHEMVVLTNHDLEATKRLLNDEEDYEQRETGV